MASVAAVSLVSGRLLAAAAASLATAVMVTSFARPLLAASLNSATAILGGRNFGQGKQFLRSTRRDIVKLLHKLNYMLNFHVLYVLASDGIVTPR